MTDYSKRSFENAAKTVEKLFGVRSLNTAIEVQSEYAKAVYDDFNAQIAKLGEHYADLAKVASPARISCQRKGQPTKVVKYISTTKPWPTAADWAFRLSPHPPPRVESRFEYHSAAARLSKISSTSNGSARSR